MAIEVISKIKQKNNGNFKLMDAVDVEYENPAMDSIAESHVDNVGAALDTVFGILNSAPVLAYVDEDGFREGEKKYWQTGEQMRLVFTFSSSASGKCTITILRDGFTFKTFSSNKGRIVVDLGAASGQSNYEYTISAVDSLGRDANQSLTFNHIIGGVELTSTFDYVIQSNVFTANSDNNISVPASITYAESGYPRYIVYNIVNKSTNRSIINGEYNCGTNNWASNIPLQGVRFGDPGVYTLTMYGKVNVGGGAELLSSVLTYDFAVISANTIAVTVTESNLEDLTTNDNVVISFRTVTNVAALSSANSMAVRCYLYMDGNSTPIKSVRMTNITSGDTTTWNIGRISNAGNYRYELVGEPLGGASSSVNIQQATGTFEVTYSSSVGGSYETSNLLAYFDANDMDNADENPNNWKAKNSGNNNYYYIKLHGLNYVKNGWQIDETDGSKMLKFTGDSYGELRHVGSSGSDQEFSPISLMNSASTGNTLEVVFRTRCIGEMDACVLSCRDESIDNYGGYSIYYDKAKISSNERSTTTPINEENVKFTHVTFVIDKNIRDMNSGISNSNIEDLNPVATMNIYVNGVRTKVIPIENNEQFANTAAFPAMQLLLNAHYDNLTRKITGFGSCEIKMLRIYNAALTAQQVLGNYINSKYDVSERQALINKNDPNRADIPVVRFVRNKTIKGNTVTFSKYSKDVSFKILNSITTKKSDDPTIPTSKNSWVNCTMWYTYLDKVSGRWFTVKYDDVDVYLQGTSTLQFPIKNYKIKVFSSSVVDGVPTRGKKYKFVPPNKIGEEGWLVEDSVYTIKCDYMEQSHKNNTPTAMIYETILDEVIKYNDGEYSPAKQESYSDCFGEISRTNDEGEVVVESKRKYRDAIAGFPILLYYNENSYVDASTGVPIDYNTLSNEEDGYYINDNDVLVGTMMYNIDKSSQALGFAPKAKEPINVINPVTKEQVKYTNGENVTLDIIPCISLEGASNSAIPAAASFYTMEEANKYTYEADYLEPQYQIMQENGAITKNMTYSEFYDNVQAGRYSTVHTYTAYCELPNTGIFKDIYKYIEATFEIRYAWTDEDIPSGYELSKKDYNECTYGYIVEAINWIDEAAGYRDKFRNEFSNYFDFSYCVTYYLQMMNLIQVDNAGKNAMFDKWFGDKAQCGGIRPRPYDMDTQVGFDNSGEDRINISAEINVALSPTGITGTYAKQAAASNMNTDSVHKRYSDYNTPNSKFWIAFGTYFRDELIRNYGHLRPLYYNADYIVDNVNALTSDIIGESFYNKDAGAKYMTQTYYEQNDNGTVSIHSDMLSRLNGNRDSRYKQVIEQRIIFMDTWFNYSGSDSANQTIDLRSDANTAGYSSVQIGVSVYSPCYVQIDVGAGLDAVIVAYVDTDETYTYGSETYEGVLFTLPIMANNKDITIHAAGNIKSINHMENLVITNISLGNAKKITSVNIPSSTALKTLALGSNTYLRSVNVSGSKTLEGNMNLSNCENIQYVNITDTKINSISLPEGGNLKQFIAENCGLTSVLFKNLQFLDTINVANCTGIVSYEIDNCPLIREVDTSGYINLNKIIITDCSGVTSLNLSKTSIAEMSITNCENIKSINLSGCNGSIMNNLNLTTVYGLQTLNISSSQPTGGIVLYLPQYKGEYASLTMAEINKLINDGVDVYWHELKTFNAGSSSLKNIAYGIETALENGICEFGRLTNLSSLTISNCTEIVEVRGLNYNGNVQSLFYGMSKLQTIVGKITSVGTSANSMFFGCTNLNNINNLILDLNSITSASSCLRSCSVGTYSMAKRVLDAMPNVVDLSTFLMEFARGTTAITLYADMLSNNTKVTSMQYFFCNCNITALPARLLDPIASTLVNARGMCYHCTGLTSVPNDIIKNCSKLTTTYEMFYNCYALTNIFNGSNYYDIFPTNSLITNTELMFYNCYGLTAPVSTGDSSNGLKKMFDNLPNLQLAEAMFYNCNFITVIPLGLFERNTKLQKICAMFKSCARLSTIPTMLFNTSVKTTTTHPNLILARGLFSSCTALTGTIGSNFFTGAFNLQNIGHINALQLGNGPVTIYAGGMFSNTAIIGYAYDFLSKLVNLTSVSMLFFKGSCTSSSMVPSSSGNNNTALTYVYVGNESYPNRIYNGIFSTLTKLQDVRYCFAGNVNFVTFCDNNGNNVNAPSLFSACKATLKTAEGLFAKCTGLSIEVPRALFQNCSALQTLRACYADCSSLSGSLPEDFLKGCTSLLYTNYMFYGCTQLGSNDAPGSISVPAGIFNDCRSKISNVAYMFYGCGFSGRIGTGSATQSVNSQGLTVYNITKYGLLSECVQLISTSAMFMKCDNLKGAIPEDIFFTHEGTMLYNLLTDISYMFNCCSYLAMSSNEYGVDGRNKATIYGEELLQQDQGYLIPTNWLNKCPNIQSIAYIFNHVSHPEYANAQYSAGNMLLSDLSFTQQVKLQNVSHAFAHCKSLAGALTAIFMQNALATLTNAEAVFAFSNLKQVGAEQYYAVFEKNTSVTARNSVLTNLQNAFYATAGNGMTGYGPSPSKFTAISASNGMVYNQTNLRNYNDYSTQQKASQQYWDTSDRSSLAAYSTAAVIS